jgi:hypothetical protein
MHTWLIILGLLALVGGALLLVAGFTFYRTPNIIMPNSGDATLEAYHTYGGVAPSVVFLGPELTDTVNSVTGATQSVVVPTFNILSVDNTPNGLSTSTTSAKITTGATVVNGRKAFEVSGIAGSLKEMEVEVNNITGPITAVFLCRINNDNTQKIAVASVMASGLVFTKTEVTAPGDMTNPAVGTVDESIPVPLKLDGWFTIAVAISTQAGIGVSKTTSVYVNDTAIGSHTSTSTPCKPFLLPKGASTDLPSSLDVAGVWTYKSVLTATEVKKVSEGLRGAGPAMRLWPVIAGGALAGVGALSFLVHPTMGSSATTSSKKKRK